MTRPATSTGDRCWDNPKGHPWKAGESRAAGGDELVAVAEVTAAGVPLRPCGELAAGLVTVDRLAAGGCEVLELGVLVLAAGETRTYPMRAMAGIVSETADRRSLTRRFWERAGGRVGVRGGRLSNDR